MAKTVEIAFAIGAALTGGFTSTFAKATQTMNELQKQVSSTQKISGQISNYQKMRGAITATQTAMLAMREQARSLDTQIETSKMQTAALQTQYRAANTEAGKSSQVLERNKTAYNNASVKVLELKGQIEASKAPTGEIKAQYAAARVEALKMKSALDQSTKSFNTAKIKAKDLNLQLKDSQKQTRQLSIEQKDLTTRADTLQGKLDRDRAALSGLRAELIGAKVNVKDLAMEQERFVSQTNRLSEAQEKFARARERVASIKAQLTWNNMKGDLLSSAATVMAFKRPIQVGMNFEQSMAQVRAVSSPTNEEFKMLREQSLYLGATTQFSAIQAAQSQENLARAGFSTTEITQALPSVLSMAAAEGMDLAQSANIIAGALGGMNLKADSSARVADVLAMTSASSKTNKNYEGSEAGNALASSMMRLNQRPKQTHEALNALGISVRTQKGDMRELPEIMKDLNKRLSKFGSEKQLEYFANIFGKEQAKPMMAFMQGVVSGEWEKIYEKDITSTGHAQKMANVRNNTLQGDITALGSAWEGLQIRIALAIEPLNRFVTQTLTNGVNKVNEFVSGHETLCKWLTQIGYVAGGLKVFETAYKYGKLLTQLPFAKLNEWLAESAAKAALTGQNFSIMKYALNILRSPLSAIKSGFNALWGVIAARPFLAIITAISLGIIYFDDIKAAAGKFVKWWNGELTLRDIFGSLYDDAVATIQKLMKPFVDFANWLSNLYTNPFKSWTAPAPETVTIGGDKYSTGGDRQVANAFNALNGWAKGGRITKPIISWIGEAGREMGLISSDNAIINSSERIRNAAYNDKAVSKVINAMTI